MSFGVISAWDAVTDQWDKFGLLVFAIPLTPFLFPSFMIRREEGMVLRRDETYPDFVSEHWVVQLKPGLLNHQQLSRH